MVALLSLNSCLRITVTDSVWWGSLGPEGSAVIHTLADVPPSQITLEQFATLWDNTSDPLVCTHSSTFATWKANLEKLCSFDNVCAYNNTTASAANKGIDRIMTANKRALENAD